MSSSLPPLNIKEVNEAMVKLLWNPDTLEDEVICMPDFPTGATLLNAAEVRESLKRGKGKACKKTGTGTGTAERRQTAEFHHRL